MKRGSCFGLLLFAVAGICFVSCEKLDIKGMFVSSGTHTEDRVSQWLEWNGRHGANLISDVPDDYKVYVCSDIHVSDSATRFKKFYADQQQDDDAVFGIVMGDLADCGGERPFELIQDAMREVGAECRNAGMAVDTCFFILGNHDIYFDCQQYYASHFHTSTYTVEVMTRGGHRDLFVFLDSGNGTHGTKQLEWLEMVLANREQYRNCIVCSHTCLFRTSYNYSSTPAANLPLEEYYHLLELMERYDVDLYMMGHFHHKEYHTIKGVDYVMTDNLNEKNDIPSYLVVSCGDNVQYTFKNLVDY